VLLEDAEATSEVSGLPSKTGVGLWRKLARSVRIKSMFMSSADDALLMGEMVSDYLEQAAADDSDRALIRKNEFGWLMKNSLASLHAEGTLPPRFEGLDAGLLYAASRALLAASRPVYETCS